MLDLNFKKFGDKGPVVIILHGLFGMLDNWQSFAKILADEVYQVYIVDQRNHGRSPSADHFNYSLLADDLNHFCQQHNLKDIHLIGHSMGGKTCMKFGLKYPFLANSQVIVDIAPKRYEGNHEGIFEALFSLNLDELKNRKEATKALSKFISEPGVIQFLLKNLERKKEGGYRFKMNLPVLFKEYQAILDNIVIDSEISYLPSLFVRGSQSNYITDEDLDLIDEVFPNNEVSTIEDAGHWIHAEQPEQLLEVILDFWK